MWSPVETIQRKNSVERKQSPIPIAVFREIFSWNQILAASVLKITEPPVTIG